VVVGSGVHSAAQIDRGTEGNAGSCVVDPSAIGVDMNVGAFGAEFAVALEDCRNMSSAPSVSLRVETGGYTIGEAQGQLLPLCTAPLPLGSQGLYSDKHTLALGVCTFAKYLQTVSAAVEISWLNGQAFPAWHWPCRKNLQGTWDVSEEAVSSGRICCVY